MAQIELAKENEDIILLNPYYALPTYQWYHLSTNGQRWQGELIAKTLYKCLIRDERANNILPEKFFVGVDYIRIDFWVPCAPLVIDNTLTFAHPHSGFSVVLDNERGNYISKVEVTTNSIYLRLNTTTTGKRVEIYYASGSYARDAVGLDGFGGNLRDSDDFRGVLTYIDDTNERATSNNDDINYRPNIIGQKYPLYNWCPPFYYLLKE
jgi:hypothetical protein